MSKSLYRKVRTVENAWQNLETIITHAEGIVEQLPKPRVIIVDIACALSGGQWHPGKIEIVMNTLLSGLDAAHFGGIIFLSERGPGYRKSISNTENVWNGWAHTRFHNRFRLQIRSTSGRINTCVGKNRSPFRYPVSIYDGDQTFEPRGYAMDDLVQGLLRDEAFGGHVIYRPNGRRPYTLWDAFDKGMILHTQGHAPSQVMRIFPHGVSVWQLPFSRT